MKTNKRWGYLNDFRKTADGNYIYTGALYRLAGNGKRYKTVFSLLCFCTAGLTAGSGCINAAGMSNTFYVILPYIFEAARAFALCYNAIRLLSAGRTVKAYVRTALEGSIPSPSNPPDGCKFHTRCANCMERCKKETPVQKEIEPGHYVVCHLYDR